MRADANGSDQPSRARIVLASVITLLTVIVVWAAIEYRTQPPPPPNPVHATAQP